MSYIQLVGRYWRELSYSILHSFFSGLGQTFLLAMAMVGIRRDFDLSFGQMGVYYSIATLGAAFFVPWSGALIDRWNLRQYSYSVGALLTISCFSLAFANSLYALVFGLFLCRLSGQALMSHISITSVSRYFDSHRGKALGIASLGRPLGEFLLPFIMTAALLAWDWRGTFVFFGLSCLLFFFPLNAILLPRNHRFFIPPQDLESNLKGFTVRDVLKSPYFYCVFPLFLISPFMLTGLFFHQSFVAQGQGWSIKWLATSFSAYALMRVVGLIWVGPLIDKFTARRLLFLCPIPLLIALMLLIFSNHSSVAIIYLGLVGLGMGMEGSIQASLWVEVYGKDHLGAIKSMVKPLVVASTALAPPMMGYPIDWGVSLKSLLSLSLIFLAILCPLCLIGGQIFLPRNTEQ